MYTFTDARAPAITDGGSDVVKMRPEPYDRTMSTSMAEPAM
jgi:hypothetical protein